MYNNCKECKIFARLNRFQLCESCNTVDNQLLEMVHETTKNEGKLTVFEMAEKLGFTPERIFRWIEEGRINANQFKHACPFCGEDLIDGSCKCASHTYIEASAEEEQVKHPERFYATLRIQRRKDKYWDEKSKIARKQRRDIWLRS